MADMFDRIRKPLREPKEVLHDNIKNQTITAESIATAFQQLNELIPEFVYLTKNDRIVEKKPFVDDEIFKNRLPRTQHNLVNKVFERLTVLCIDGHLPNGSALWRCRCTCGNIKHTTTQNLLKGKVKSCGCLKANKGIKSIEKDKFISDMFASIRLKPHREPVEADTPKNDDIYEGFTDDSYDTPP